MGFLSKIAGIFTPKPGPTPADRVPALAPLIEAMAGDLPAFWPGFFSSLAGQWDLRFDAVEALVKQYLLPQPEETRRATLDALVTSDRASWLLVSAVLRNAEAWAARGSGRKVKNPDLFHKRLMEAATEAGEVLDLDPRDPASCALLVRITKGLGDDARRDAAYQEAIKRAPHAFRAHLEYNICLSERWGGSLSGQTNHAREVGQAAPNGSLAAGLVVNATYFGMSHLIIFDNKAEAARAKVAKPAVLDEVKQACARSIDDSGHVLSAGTFDIRTKAAMIAWQANDADFTRQQLAGLGDVFIENTWSQITPDPKDWFNTLRKMYGLG